MYLSRVALYFGHMKKKWLALSNPPQAQEGLGTIFFR